MRVDLNSDLGESFGAWKMGDDEAMLGIITSASVACGWHAGDPVVMHRAASWPSRMASPSARTRASTICGASAGASSAAPASPTWRSMIAYQIGALQAIATTVGHKVTHVKAHGALGNLANDEDEFAMALGRAIKAVDPRLVYVVMPGRPSVAAAEKLGLPMLQEIFADRAYQDNGQLVMRGQPGAVIHDAERRRRAHSAGFAGQRDDLRHGQQGAGQDRQHLRARRHADGRGHGAAASAAAHRSRRGAEALHRLLTCRWSNPDGRPVHPSRHHPRRHAERARLRGMPQDRQPLGAPAHLPHLRARGLLRRVPQQARHQAFPRHRASHHRGL